MNRERSRELVYKWPAPFSLLLSFPQAALLCAMLVGLARIFQPNTVFLLVAVIVPVLSILFFFLCTRRYVYSFSPSEKKMERSIQLWWFRPKKLEILCHTEIAKIALKPHHGDGVWWWPVYAILNDGREFLIACPTNQESANQILADVTLAVRCTASES